MFRRGAIWMVDLREPEYSEPGYVRPVLILQSNAFNRTRIRTLIGVCITTNQDRGAEAGNVPIAPAESGLRQISVVNVSQIITFDNGVGP